MRYWFEEPKRGFVELSDLYDKHTSTTKANGALSRRNAMRENAGLVELAEINHVHRRAEFQIIISPEYCGKRPGVTRGQTGDGLRIYRTHPINCI